MIAEYFVFILVGLWLFVSAKRRHLQFLDRYPTISDAAALDDLKVLARWSMKMALLIIAIFVFALIWVFEITTSYGLYGTAAVLLMNLPLFLASRNLKAIEARTKSMECAENLKAEYERVCQIWSKKVWPNF